MSVAHALFLTLILLNYERRTRLVMVLRAPLSPWAQCAGALARGVCRWLSGSGRAGAQDSPHHWLTRMVQSWRGPQLLRKASIGWSTGVVQSGAKAQPPGPQDCHELQCGAAGLSACCRVHTPRDPRNGGSGTPPCSPPAPFLFQCLSVCLKATIKR